MSNAPLPIEQLLPEVLGAMSNSRALVLQAEPGAGKSTVLPLALLKAPWLAGQRIIMLEPRRVAARNIAHFLAKQLGEEVGQTIGYQVRNDRRCSKKTRLEIVTEGILTRRLQSDPELAGIGLIIFDEFHERSLQADLALMLSLEVQQALRDDLKLLVMSATLDTAVVADYLGDAAVIDCPGRAHPVSVTQLAAPEPRALPDAVARTVVSALRETASGDLLVFLPGKREIERCIQATRDQLDRVDSLTASDIELLPLYGGLPLAEQERVLTQTRPDQTPSAQTNSDRANSNRTSRNRTSRNRRRVIFSTNIAETSLTIPGITGVIDSGLERRVHYDPGSDMTRLETARISKASATQRAGRAGRLGPGYCWRLWPESVHRDLPAQQPEEILGADLSSLVLELLTWGLASYDATPWLTAPPRAHYEAAVGTLQRLGLIVETSAGKSLDTTLQLSSLASNLIALSMHPRIGVMLLRARDLTTNPDETSQLIGLACRVAALLGDRDIFHNRQSADLDARLIALLDYEQDRKRALSNHPLHRGTAAEVLVTAQQLKRRLGRGTGNEVGEAAQDGTIADVIEGGPEGVKTPRGSNRAANPRSLNVTPAQRQLWLAQLLLLAYPDRIAKQRGDSSRYQLANGKGVTLAEGDPLTGQPWLIVTDWDGKQSDGRVFSAVAVDQTTVKEFMWPLSDIKSEVTLGDEGRVPSRRKQRFYQALMIDAGQPEPISGSDLLTYLPEIFKARGLSLLNWTTACEQWLGRATWLGTQDSSFPQLDTATLVATVDQWLLPYINRLDRLQDLKRLVVLDLIKSLLSYSQQQQLETEAPASYTAPSGKTVDVIYDPIKGPTVSIQLQELFGELSSPLLGGGRVPLRFELLSPARRPIQTTSDLAGFWQSSYFEVAKEMRGRYPKHRWPEKPLEEQAGKSLKRRQT